MNVVRYFTSWVEPVLISSDSATPKSLTSSSQHSEILSHWQSKEHYSCLYLQTEYCGAFTLRDFIRDPHRVPNRTDNLHLLSQMLLGLSHVHSKALLHRDLKPSNIFLVDEHAQKHSSRDAQHLTIKIGDFGLSKSMSDTLIDEDENVVTDLSSSSDLTANLGTLLYAAPEQLQCEAVYGTPADMFSLGVMLFELIQPAFDTEMERSLAMSRFRRTHTVDADRVDTVLFAQEVELMLQMTHSEPKRRPSAHSLIASEFIGPFWMKNIVQSAMPQRVPRSNSNNSTMPMPMSQHGAQRSLEYHTSDEIQVEVVHPYADADAESAGKPKGRPRNDSSPSFLVTCPACFESSDQCAQCLK